jgi:hypothetical protein
MRMRRVVIALPVVLTLLIAVVIGGLIAWQDQRQSDQVRRAETIAQDYLAKVDTFRSAAVKKIAHAGVDDPGELKRVVDRVTAHPPRLRPASGYGEEHSSLYAEAAQTEATVLQPFRRLSATLARADVALDFIRAARHVLELRATDYVGTGYITSSAAVRSSLIPAVVKVRDELDATRVPKGQGRLARQVRDAAQYVIDRATLLADRLDRRQSFSFSYQEEFRAASEAVNGYATRVKGDITEAVNAVAADS